MTAAGRRVLVGALLASLTGVVGVVPSGPAAARSAPAVATEGPCPTTTQGVTVVVDFHGIGGRGAVTRCSPGSPGTGFVALREAGFTITPAATNLAFLCRIDGLPTPQDDPCQVPSPATAYWSYWTADRGGSWGYQSEGGATRKPRVGGVEGWSFSRSSSEATAQAPGIAPPAKPTTTTTARPATTVTTRPTGGPGPTPAPTTAPTADPPTSRRPSGDRTTTTALDRDGPDDGSAADGGDGPAPTSEDGTPPSTPTGGDEAAAGTVDARDREGGGSPLGAIVAGAGVALLLGTAGVAARRRRSRAS